MKTLQALVFCALLLVVASCTRPGDRALGDWHGTLATPRGELSLVVRISDASGALGGTMESPDQAPGELMPLANVQAESQRLAFDVPSIKGAFAGRWDERAGGWSGTWLQSGYKLPLVLSPGPAMSAVKGLDGVWRATVRRGDQTRRLVLRIETTGQSTSIKFDAPDAGAIGLAVSGFTHAGNRIRFAVPTAGASFDGALASDGQSIAGTWSFQSQPPVQIVFARSAAQAAQAHRVRPQTPVAPFPYAVEDVRIANPKAPGVVLGCTLTLPRRAGPFPAAVLLTGSGAQDRDETMYEHKPFAVLADHLTRQGIAVLRCDDRGVAASTGTFETATTLDFATDADAAAAYLASRREIKKSAIGLVGHSEGGLVAYIAASADARIGYLVLLAAPATDMRRMLVTQSRLLGQAQGRPEKDVAATAAVVERILDAVATAGSDAQAADRLGAILTPEALAELQIPASNKPLFVQTMANVWMRQLLTLDPASYLAKVTVPVLALEGSLDRQVAPDDNLAAIKAGLPPRADLTQVKLQGLNHFFQTAKTGAIGEYVESEETMSPAALRTVSDWIVKRFAR